MKHGIPILKTILFLSIIIITLGINNNGELKLVNQGNAMPVETTSTQSGGKYYASTVPCIDQDGVIYATAVVCVSGSDYVCIASVCPSITKKN